MIFNTSLSKKESNYTNNLISNLDSFKLMYQITSVMILVSDKFIVNMIKNMIKNMIENMIKNISIFNQFI
jgi:hypothetical protein